MLLKPEFGVGVALDSRAKVAKNVRFGKACPTRPLFEQERDWSDGCHAVGFRSTSKWKSISLAMRQIVSKHLSVIGRRTLVQIVWSDASCHAAQGILNKTEDTSSLTEHNNENI
jgi:hypothetical protein